MLTPTRSAPAEMGLSPLRATPHATIAKENTESTTLHGSRLQGQDPHPQQHSEQHHDKSTCDDNGSCVPYIEPTTGTHHMLPMAIVVRLNEDDNTNSKAAAAAPAATAAATGFFENVISCFTPIFSSHQSLMDKTNKPYGKLSIAERLEQVADVDNTSTIPKSW